MNVDAAAVLEHPRVAALHPGTICASEEPMTTDTMSEDEQGLAWFREAVSAGNAEDMVIYSPAAGVHLSVSDDGELVVERAPRWPLLDGVFEAIAAHREAIVEFIVEHELRAECDAAGVEFDDATTDAVRADGIPPASPPTLEGAPPRWPETRFSLEPMADAARGFDLLYDGQPFGISRWFGSRADAAAAADLAREHGVDDDRLHCAAWVRRFDAMAPRVAAAYDRIGIFPGALGPTRLSVVRDQAGDARLIAFVETDAGEMRGFSFVRAMAPDERACGACAGCHARAAALAAHDAPSWVYFLQAGARGAIKIGTSTNLQSRIDTLQTAHPEPLRLLATVPGGVAIERVFHAAFAAHRKQGEWFEPAPELLRAIDELRRTR
jgi:hypothetical protein